MRGGGTINRGDKDKLERFTKDKNKKIIIIFSTIGISLLVGAITLYRTFALYEERLEFNVLQGKIPEYNNDIILAMTVDGEKTDQIPERGEYGVNIVCDKGSASWDYINWKPIINNMDSSKVRCSLDFYKTDNQMMNRDSTKAFWQEEYRTKITKVIFETKIEPRENAIAFDISANQNGSVMSYLVPDTNQEGYYILYIEANGLIKAPVYSRELFAFFSNVKSYENLEYLDMKNVGTTSYMFSGNENLKELDVSSFDMSNVESSDDMFSYCYELEKLNINWANTSNIIYSPGMFFHLHKLTILDASSLNIGNNSEFNVMFAESYKLTYLDISNSTFTENRINNIVTLFNSIPKKTFILYVKDQASKDFLLSKITDLVEDNIIIKN